VFALKVCALALGGGGEWGGARRENTGGGLIEAKKFLLEAGGTCWVVRLRGSKWGADGRNGRGVKGRGHFGPPIWFWGPKVPHTPKKRGKTA